MEHRTHTILESPIGPLTLVAGDGALVALFMDEQRHPQDRGDLGDPSAEPFATAATQLRAYFAGELTEFDLPIAAEGTAFQHTVWALLRRIPYGETTTYGRLAEQLGKPTAARAVGLANGRNPISIIVPCHRVVGSTGNLTGYGGGLDRKRFLLDHERIHQRL